MKLRQLMIFGLCLAIGAMFSNAAAAERRVALVIGNSAYKNAATLSNTTNDSYSMEALRVPARSASLISGDLRKHN